MKYMQAVLTDGTGQNVCATQTPQQLEYLWGMFAVNTTGTTTIKWIENDSGPWALISPEQQIISYHLPPFRNYLV